MAQLICNLDIVSPPEGGYDVKQVSKVCHAAASNIFALYRRFISIRHGLVERNRDTHSRLAFEITAVVQMIKNFSLSYEPLLDRYHHTFQDLPMRSKMSFGMVYSRTLQVMHLLTVL